MPTESPIVSRAPTRVTKTKAGRSDQKTRAEAEIEARPGAGGEPDPRRVGDPRNVVDAEIAGDAAGGDDADHRRPQAQRSLRFQGRSRR